MPKSELHAKDDQARAAAQARLARLKAKRFSATDQKERVARALQALATLPDTIRLNNEDVHWIAENSEIEDQ